MLVLSRKVGESIFIGGKTKVLIVESKGGSVKIGVEAPSNVLVYRGEIYEKIMEENKSSSSVDVLELTKMESLITGNRVKK